MWCPGARRCTWSRKVAADPAMSARRRQVSPCMPLFGMDELSAGMLRRYSDYATSGQSRQWRSRWDTIRLLEKRTKRTDRAVTELSLANTNHRCQSWRMCSEGVLRSWRRSIRRCASECFSRITLRETISIGASTTWSWLGSTQRSCEERWP